MVSVKIRIVWTFLLIGWAFNLHSILYSQSCEVEWLKEGRSRLERLIFAYQTQTSLVLADSLLDRFDKGGLSQCKDALWILFNRGEVLELHNRYQEALKTYYTLIENHSTTEDLPLVASCHLSIARCMESLGRKSDCKRHLDLAYDLIENDNLNKLLPFLYLRLPSYLRIFESRDSARKVVNQAMHWSESFKINRYWADSYLLKAFLSEQGDSAIYNFKQAMHYFLENDNYDGACYMVKGIISKYRDNNNVQLYAQWLDTMGYYLNYIKELNPSTHLLLSAYYNDRAIQFEKIHEFDSASHYFKIAGFHKEQQLLNVNHEEVSQAEIDYFLKAEKERTSVLEKQSEFQKLGLILLFIVLATVSSLFYNNYLKRKKIEQQKEFILKQNDELNTSLMRQNILLSEVHHRVKNNLQLVISLLTLHYDKMKNKEDFHYLEEIANKIRSIALILEHLYNSGEFEQIELGAYIKEMCEHYLSLHTHAHRFEYVVISEAPLYLNLETTMPIGIICTEQISNSLKYARRDNTVLRLEFKLGTLDHKFVLKYQDNGLSQTVGHISKEGMGTMLIESMVRQLQAQSSASGQGTSSFNLIFQEKKVSIV